MIKPKLALLEVTAPLIIIHNKSIQTGVVPLDWKMYNVAPEW